MLQLYGNPRSRAMRCLWMLEEVGQPYQLVDKSLRADDLHSADYLKLNPNARIPTLVDGELVLWESMAINLYQDDGGEAEAIQWSFWIMTEVEKKALTALLHRFLLPEDKRDSKLADEAEHQLQKPLSVLDQRLATTGYLIGETFTVADLNVASVLSWARIGGVALSAFPNMDQWLAGCLKRAAAVRARNST